MNAAHVRAWWWHRQGLDGSLVGATPAEVLTRTGWARSVGGANPYLSLHARAGTGRADVDAAVAAAEICELPSARGCTYVLPAAHYALGLKAGQGFSAEAEVRTAKTHAGVTDTELETLCAAVLQALDAGPDDPAGLRKTLGDQVRSFDEEAAKRGLSTTLPLALGLLQAQGEIRRIPSDGRLDSQRYRYTRWASPLADRPLSKEDAYAELAELFFEWTGPATLAHFQWFSGLGVKAAKAATASLSLVEVTGGLLAPGDLAEAVRDYEPPTHPVINLVGWLDSLVLLRRDLASLVAAKDLSHPLLAAATQAGGALGDLPNQAIVDRGQLIGLWDYDPDARRIVWATFRPAPAEVADAVAGTEAYIAADLGDVRSSSMDSPESRRPRLDALRSQR